MIRRRLFAVFHAQYPSVAIFRRCFSFYDAIRFSLLAEPAAKKNVQQFSRLHTSRRQMLRVGFVARSLSPFSAFYMQEGARSYVGTAAHQRLRRERSPPAGPPDTYPISRSTALLGHDARYRCFSMLLKSCRPLPYILFPDLILRASPRSVPPSPGLRHFSRKLSANA